MQSIKPGYLTTEFALVVAGMLVALTVRLGLITPQGAPLATQETAQTVATLVIGALPVVYATLRTWLKAHAPILPELPATVPTVLMSSTPAVAAPSSTVTTTTMYTDTAPTKRMPAVKASSPAATVPPVNAPTDSNFSAL